MTTVVIASSVDPCRSPHTRLHEIASALARRNDVTIVSVGERERGHMPDADRYTESSRPFLQGIREAHVAEGEVPMALQDGMARWLARRLVPPLGRPEAFLDYNTISLGAGLEAAFAREDSTRVPRRVYDLADYLPRMVGRAVRPRFPLGPLAVAAAELALRRTLARASHVSTPYPALPEKMGVPADKVLSVPNGVDPVLFSPRLRERARERYRVPDTGPVVGYVGSLREWVDFEPVLRAMQRLRAEHGRCPHLLVAGREGGFEALRARATRLGLRDFVTLLGTILYEEVPWFLSACDLAIVPFRRGVVAEYAVPLKVLEALACGVPVACPSLRGIMDTVGKYVIRCDTSDAYASVLRSLSDNPGEFRSLDAAAREDIRSRFAWSATLRPLIQVLEGRMS